MNEITYPPLVERPDVNSTVALIRERAEAAPDHVAFHVRTGEGYSDYTLIDFIASSSAVARGLISRGFAPGDRGAVMAATSYEWAVVEFAIWQAGGIVVPIYDTTPAEKARAIIADSDVKVLFVDESISDEIRGISTGLGTWLIRGESDSIATLSVRAGSGLDEELARREAGLTRTNVASIVYTSGTTGDQKGTRITHANFVDLVLNVQAGWKDVLNENGRTIIFLPLAHVLARGLQMICMWAGMRVTHMSKPSELIASLPELTPTFLVVVPRVLEKIVAAVSAKAEEKKIRKLWEAAEKTAAEWGQALETKDLTGHWAPSRSLKIRHALFDKLFFAKIRTLLGGNIEFLLSGAAALNPHLSLAFRGMGVPIMEGYGLTETTAPMSGNRPGRIKSGTVGEPVPGTTVRIADDGRILVSGIGVADGYVKDEHTEAAFADGFFDTGDLGFLDEDGYLTVNGRLKDVLVTAGGKTVSPAGWEALMEADPLIAHAVMVGENKPYLGALLILERTELQAWADEHGEDFEYAPGDGPAEVSNPALLEKLKNLVDQANSTVARSETVKTIRALLVDVSEESGLLTPTLKIKRSEAITKLAAFVDDLYDREDR